MKQFNEIISVQVSVDMIAHQLREVIDKDFKHRDLLTEAIIATTKNDNTLGNIMGALAGYRLNLNFAVGDTVICSIPSRVVATQRNLQGRIEDSTKEKIGQCVVTDIDEFRSKEKVRVKFKQDSWYHDKTEEVEIWVDHTACDRIPTDEESPVETLQ